MLMSKVEKGPRDTTSLAQKFIMLHPFLPNWGRTFKPYESIHSFTLNHRTYTVFNFLEGNEVITDTLFINRKGWTSPKGNFNSFLPKK